MNDAIPRGVRDPQHGVPRKSDPMHMAVVGSGPAGFYTTKLLFERIPDVHVDMFEKLPVPYGLVRHGVAPDHPKIKSVSNVFERVGGSAGFRFFGNVEIGRDLDIGDLARCYHAVVLAIGAEHDAGLTIPGHDLPGSFGATEFVGWYNGHPRHVERHVDLSCSDAVIIGHGNVALDVARILARSTLDLGNTDIAEPALNALRTSRIRSIHIIGRRGPAQASFGAKELRHFATLTDVSLQVAERDLELNEASAAELASPAGASARETYRLLQSFARGTSAGATKTCVIRFMESPVQVEGSSRITAVATRVNRLEGPAFEQRAVATAKLRRIRCGLLVRCVGHRVDCIDGLPYDQRRGTLQNEHGRLHSGEAAVGGMYVAGWAKRGACGTIGTNRSDCEATVESIIADLPDLPRPTQSADTLIERLRDASELETVDFDGWRRIDAVERERGANHDPPRPRLKITSICEMLATATQTHPASGWKEE